MLSIIQKKLLYIIQEVLMLKKKVFRLPLLIGTLLCAACAALIVACGGGSSYSDLDAKYYAGEENVNVLLEPDQLYTWIKNGYKTDDGKPVVVIDIVPNPGDEEKWFAGNVTKIAATGFDGASAANDAGFLGHIPGSMYSVSHEGYMVTNRNDGPVDADHMVGTGSLVTQFLQKYGITKDTVVVFTQSNLVYPGFCPARYYWTFRYWGMSKNNLRILNGSTIAWAKYIAASHPGEVESMGLQKGMTVPTAAASTLDVADFPVKNFDIRASIGEVIDDVDSGKTTDGSVALLDGRQPPTAFYFNNISEYVGSDLASYTLKTAAGNNMPEWDDTGFMPMDFNGADTNGDGVVSAYATKLKAFMKGGFPYAVNISAKGAAFDGEIKGSILTKGKAGGTVPFNITAPAFINLNTDKMPPSVVVFNEYKKPTDIAFPVADWDNNGTPENVTVEAMFAKAFPDKNQQIITYCNSGAMAAQYWFYMTEVLGYKNVKLYDGSWIEWGSQAAFEPANTSFVRSETYNWLPKKVTSVNLNMPKFLIFGSGDFSFFNIEKNADGTYNAVDELTGTKCVVGATGCGVKKGGNLSGNVVWDTISRSEKIIFRPTSTVNTGIYSSSDKETFTKEYNSSTDWPTVVTHPNYSGTASEVKKVDKAYKGTSGSSSSGSSPEAFVPSGGGC